MTLKSTHKIQYHTHQINFLFKFLFKQICPNTSLSKTYNFNISACMYVGYFCFSRLNTLHSFSLNLMRKQRHKTGKCKNKWGFLFFWPQDDTYQQYQSYLLFTCSLR
jgi:hypothetical protein